ncbi:hypothetical protein B7486_13355 [cyanobacterium TDX16]|nr:hypothetical protein B7486_13355 [cyanobacterium TDX16]
MQRQSIDWPSEDNHLSSIPLCPLGKFGMRAPCLGLCLHPRQFGGAGLIVTVWINDQFSGQRHGRSLDALVTGHADISPRHSLLGVGRLYASFQPTPRIRIVTNQSQRLPARIPLRQRALYLVP